MFMYLRPYDICVTGIVHVCGACVWLCIVGV